MPRQSIEVTEVVSAVALARASLSTLVVVDTAATVADTIVAVEATIAAAAGTAVAVVVEAGS
jgi:hypothetical protein